MADFKTIETQEQLNIIIGERLSRQQKDLEEKFKSYLSPDQLKDHDKELSDKITSLTEQLTGMAEKNKGFEQQIADLTAKNKAHETASVKARIAHETGLKFEAIKFLQGETEEEIAASAKELKALQGAINPPAANNNPKPGGDSTTEALKETIKNLGL